MRIDFHYGPQIKDTDLSTTRTAASPANSAGGASQPEDEAVLSRSHVQVQSLAAQALQLPEVRSERVQALREAVRSGKYQSDAKQIAGAMLHNEGLSFLG